MKKSVSLLLALLLLAAVCTGCSKSPTALKVGDYEVSEDMLRYFVKNYMNGYADYSDEDFRNDPELQAALSENVEASLRELAAYSLLADTYKLKLSDAQKDEIEAEIKNLRESYDSEDEYKADLAANFVTEDVLREIFRVEKLSDRLYDYLTLESGAIKWSVEIIDEDFPKTFYSSEHILIYYGENDAEEKLKFAEDTLEKLKSGALSMAEFDLQYETTFGLKYEYQKYDTFTEHGELEDGYVEKVSALKIGDYSEVTDYYGTAFLIVHRLPLDMAYYNEHYNTVEGQWLAREYYKIILQYADGLDYTFKRKYRDLKLYEME